MQDFEPDELRPEWLAAYGDSRYPRTAAVWTHAGAHPEAVASVAAGEHFVGGAALAVAEFPGELANKLAHCFIRDLRDDEARDAIRRLDAVDLAGRWIAEDADALG